MARKPRSLASGLGHATGLGNRRCPMGGGSVGEMIKTKDQRPAVDEVEKKVPNANEIMKLARGSRSTELLTTFLDYALTAGFVFYTCCAGAAERTRHAGAWPFWAVWRSSEFGELSSLCLCTNDTQCSPTQIAKNIRITAIPHLRQCGNSVVTSRYRRVKRGGAVHCTKPG